MSKRCKMYMYPLSIWGYCPIQDSENGKSFTASRAMKIEFIELALLETLEQIFGENPI